LIYLINIKLIVDNDVQQCNLKVKSGGRPLHYFEKLKQRASTKIKKAKGEWHAQKNYD